jgi:hypothetical protein
VRHKRIRNERKETKSVRRRLTNNNNNNNNNNNVAIEFPLDGSSPYTSTDKTNKNKYT